ncbi:MAG: hypothetical protein LBV50_08375 [Novosphingobium sp.]|jgi:hypothetical protein|nr:hypothetical protein [Novosphingobium sp.]
MQETQPSLVPSVATPQHYVPATARELRVQAVHRLQIGLFGLAAMLLLVGLANIIMDRARLADKADAAVQVPTIETVRKNSDPLADIGVVPAAEPTSSAMAAPAQ